MQLIIASLSLLSQFLEPITSDFTFKHFYCFCDVVHVAKQLKIIFLKKI